MKTMRVPIVTEGKSAFLEISEELGLQLLSLSGPSSDKDTVKLQELEGKTEGIKVLLEEIRESVKMLKPGIVKEILTFAGKDQYLQIGRELGYLEKVVDIAEKTTEEQNTLSEKTGKAAIKIVR